MDELRNRTLDFLLKGFPLVLVYSALFLAIPYYGWSQVWSSLNVRPAMEPGFADLRVIVGASISLKLGYDPLTDNPGDFWQRPMNYPRIWIVLNDLFHVNQGNAYLVGYVFVLLFGGCLLVILGHQRTVRSYLIILLCALSSSVFLAIERGNTDLVIFALVFIALAAADSWGICIVLLAGILKLYPAVLFFLALWSRWRAIALCSLSAFLMYLFYIRADLALIGRATPASATLSYGVVSTQLLAAQWLGHSQAEQKLVLLLLWLIASLIIVGGAVFSMKQRNSWSAQSVCSANRFIGFGSIYLSTFFASNWDYRLIFLIPTIPMAWNYYRGTGRKIGLIHCVAVVVAMNYGLFEALRPSLVTLVLMAKWLIVFTLSFLSTELIRARPLSLSWCTFPLRRQTCGT